MTGHRDMSYSMLAKLEVMFNEQCKKRNVKWTDKDVRYECLLDFQGQYVSGEDNPEVLLLGYGYEIDENAE